MNNLVEIRITLVFLFGNHYRVILIPIDTVLLNQIQSVLFFNYYIIYMSSRLVSRDAYLKKQI